VFFPISILIPKCCHSIAVTFNKPGYNFVRKYQNASKVDQKFPCTKKVKAVNKNSWNTYLKKYLRSDCLSHEDGDPALSSYWNYHFLFGFSNWFLNYVNTNPAAKKIFKLATTVEPETFTELYFENHTTSSQDMSA